MSTAGDVHRPPPGYALVEVLTGGPFFHVMLVTRDGMTLVAKRANARFASDPAGVEMIVAEAAVLARLDGVGAPKLVASGTDTHGPFVVSEWCSGTAIGDLVHDAHLSWMRVHALFDGLAYLHFRRVTHGDPSPTNIFLDGSQALFLDFGLATLDGRTSRGGAFAGTLAYSAPEVARDGARAVASASDVFAVAATLLHHLSGHAPRPNLPAPALLVHVAEIGIDSAAFAPLPPDLATLLGLALSPDPADRPTARWLADESARADMARYKES